MSTEINELFFPSPEELDKIMLEADLTNRKTTKALAERVSELLMNTPTAMSMIKYMVSRSDHPDLPHSGAVTTMGFIWGYYAALKMMERDREEAN